MMFKSQIFRLAYNNISGSLKEFQSPTYTIIKKFSSMVRSGNKQQQRGHRQESNLSLSSTSLSSSSRSIKSSSSLKTLTPQIHSTLNSAVSVAPPVKKMKVYPIRALQDNYMYLLVDESTKTAAAVDPVNASAISSAITDYGVDLKCVLTTHHHYDHANGNNDMVSMYPDITVYGGDSRIQALTKTVSHGEIIRLGSLTIECLATPCHSRGHICYYVHNEESPSTIIQTFKSNSGSPLSSTPDMASSDFPVSPPQQAPQSNQQSTLGTTATKSASGLTSSSGQQVVERVVFTGDTLFIAGCGRFFEGTPEQMDHNLNVILGGLPPETRVYCGHEYTIANLKFALTVEPQNSDIKMKLDWAQSKVAKREPTVPSTISEEKRINPFMRLSKPQVKKFAKEQNDIEVISVLRQKKNEFVP